MQFTVALIAITAFASNVLAGAPWPAGKGSAAPSAMRPHQTGANPWSGCLSEATASDIVTKYTYLLENPTGADFNSTANTLLTDDFVVWSDSIQFLGGKPVSLPSRTTETLLTFLARHSFLHIEGGVHCGSSQNASHPNRHNRRDLPWLR